MIGITLVTMQTLSVKLPDELHALLAQEAKARRVAKSQVLHESIEQTLRPLGAEPSCYDLSHYLIGTIHGLPADLAENPKYMEDFGQCFEGRFGSRCLSTPARW